MEPLAQGLGSLIDAQLLQLFLKFLGSCLTELGCVLLLKRSPKPIVLVDTGPWAQQKHEHQWTVKMTVWPSLLKC